MRAQSFADPGHSPRSMGGRAVCPQCSADRLKNTQRCLSVDSDRGVFYCFHCGWKGGLKTGANFKLINLNVIRRKKKQDHQRGALRAREKWNASHHAFAQHPYLCAKQIEPLGIRQHGNYLIVPIYDGEQISSLQSIGPEGDKKFLPGGKVKSCYFILPGTTQRVLLCEGYATAVTLHCVNGEETYAALSAMNMPDVAIKARLKYPDSVITVCADNDPAGRKHGMKAAGVVSGKFCTPPKEGHDFNDWAREE